MLLIHHEADPRRVTGIGPKPAQNPRRSRSLERFLLILDEPNTLHPASLRSQIHRHHSLSRMPAQNGKLFSNPYNALLFNPFGMPGPG
jgi:hypothetical protein